MKKLLALLFVFLFLLSFTACAKQSEKEAYNNAQACLAQKRYVDAATFFAEANGYKDSEQKLLEIYYHAITLFETGLYEDAKVLFDILATEQVNDSTAYSEILDAYLTFLKDFNVCNLLNSLESHTDISGVSAIMAQVEDLCYPGTHVIMLEYIVPNIDSLRVSCTEEDYGDDPFWSYDYFVNKADFSIATEAYSNYFTKLPSAEYESGKDSKYYTISDYAADNMSDYLSATDFRAIETFDTHRASVYYSFDPHFNYIIINLFIN